MLGVKEIQVGETVNGAFSVPTLPPVYYKIRPPAGEDVVISLSGFAVNSWFELFVGCEKMPTESDFCYVDSGYDEAAKVTIVNSSGGWYYLMLVPRLAPNSMFELKSSVIDYSLGYVGLAEGGNTGRVTVPIAGAKFRPGIQAFLIGSDLVEHEAVSVYFESSTRIYATFDLAGFAPGNHDVRVTLDGSSLALDGAFKVVPGIPGHLETRINVPDSVRIGRSYMGEISYHNAGNTDLISPLVIVASPSGSLVKLFPEDDFVNPSVPFLAIASDGPAGILRPGQWGSVFVYVMAKSGDNILETNIRTIEDTTTMNWDEVKASIKPDTASADWDPA